MKKTRGPSEPQGTAAHRADGPFAVKDHVDLSVLEEPTASRASRQASSTASATFRITCAGTCLRRFIPQSFLPNRERWTRIIGGSLPANPVRIALAERLGGCWSGTRLNIRTVNRPGNPGGSVPFRGEPGRRLPAVCDVRAPFVEVDLPSFVSTWASRG